MVLLRHYITDQAPILYAMVDLTLVCMYTLLYVGYVLRHCMDSSCQI